VPEHCGLYSPMQIQFTVSTPLCACRPRLPVAVQMVSIILNCSSLHAVSPGASVMSYIAL
jgi:hypothetical protein